jgi:hypothetical protein
LAGALVGSSCGKLMKTMQDGAYAISDEISTSISSFFFGNNEIYARRMKKIISGILKCIFELVGFLGAIALGAGVGAGIGSVTGFGTLPGFIFGGAASGLHYAIKKVL